MLQVERSPPDLPRRALSRMAKHIKKTPAAADGYRCFLKCRNRDEGRSVLGRPGSDLLFQVLRLSTIGAGEFNGRVRNGIGFRLSAKTTRPAKDGFEKQSLVALKIGD